MQRCRNHKMRNVTGHLPKELHDEARAVLRAAWKSARRARRDVHRQRDRTDPGAPAVPGHDQRDRQRALAHAPPHRPGDPVERRVHGGALGGRRVFWTPRRATAGSWATRTSGCSRRTWTSSALPRLTERRLPRKMNRPRATATSNYGWDSLLYNQSGAQTKHIQHQAGHPRQSFAT